MIPVNTGFAIEYTIYGASIPQIVPGIIFISLSPNSHSLHQTKANSYMYKLHKPLGVFNVHDHTVGSCTDGIIRKYYWQQYLTLLTKTPSDTEVAIKPDKHNMNMCWPNMGQSYLVPTTLSISLPRPRSPVTQIRHNSLSVLPAC